MYSNVPVNIFQIRVVAALLEKILKVIFILANYGTPAVLTGAPILNGPKICPVQLMMDENSFKFFLAMYLLVCGT